MIDGVCLGLGYCAFWFFFFEVTVTISVTVLFSLRGFGVFSMFLSTQGKWVSFEWGLV